MKIILICVYCSAIISASAQQKIHFGSQNYVGLAEGENGSAFQLQTINGISYRSWFAGAGVGLDWYYLRSIPLFASINKSLFEKNNRIFFISADIGVNFSWVPHYPDEWDYGSTGNYRNGKYFSSGLGYKIGVGKGSDAILLHIGYSYKDLSEKVKTVYPCLVGPCPEQVDVYNFHLRRLSLRLGWSF